MELLKDNNGDVITQPLVAFGTTTVAVSSVLVQLQFVNSEADLQRDELRAVQLVMTPQQAADLAASLERVARLLRGDSDTPAAAKLN